MIMPWNGKITEELRELALKYEKEHRMGPDCYDDLCYDDMTYDEFVGYIKKALKRHCSIEDVVDRRLL